MELCRVFKAADKTAGGVGVTICIWGELIGLGGLPGDAGELGSLSLKLPLVLSMLEITNNRFINTNAN